MDKNVSFITIIQHIQSDLSDLIRDYSSTNKNLKIKVNSIKGSIFLNFIDTFKILNAKLTPYINDENKYLDKLQEEIVIFKADLEFQKKNMENQIKTLKQENYELIKEIENMKNEVIFEDRIKEHKPIQEINESPIKKTDSEYYSKYVKAEEELANYKNNFEQIINILREEEKNKINLEEELNNYKDAIIELKEEIENISGKLEKKCQDYDVLDKINNEMRNNYYDLKPKFEELIKINVDLKAKYIEKTNEHNTFLENNKGVYKKLSLIQKRNEELEKDQSKNLSELSIKEERLTALRTMNIKLENKINEIMKKFGKIRILEETSSQIQKKYNDLYDIITNLSLEKISLRKENEELKGQQYGKKKDDIVNVDSGTLSDLQQTDQDTSKRFKRNARSISMVSSSTMKNSNNNIY